MNVKKSIIISLLVHGIILIAFYYQKENNSKQDVPFSSTQVELLDSLPLVDQARKNKFERVPHNPTVNSGHNQAVDKETIVRKKDLDFGISRKDMIGTIPTEKNGSSNSEVIADELRGIEEGSETVLNSREVLYFSFYERAKIRLENYWRPNVRKTVYQILDRQNTLLLSSRITKLLIYLDKDGNLVNVQVIKDSGLIDLDNVAIQAFKSAEPFPNPPKALIEEDGLVKIRWDFVVER